MAKRKPEEPKKGAPAWQCTFGDLMNLLLCFFVLLFCAAKVQLILKPPNKFYIFAKIILQ